MPIDMKKIKASKAAAEKERFSGIPALNAPAIHADLFDSIVGSSAKVVDLTSVVPPAEYCNIMWCGDKGGAKTATIVGNPRAVILKCGDGSSAAPRKHPNARIIECNHYAYRGPGDKTSFEKNLDLVLDYAAKTGEDGDHCTLVIDPLYSLVQWLMSRELDSYNAWVASAAESSARKAAAEAAETGAVLPTASSAPRRLESMREMRDANTVLIPKIGEKIGATMHRVNGLGWGFHTCVHYRVTYDHVEKKTVIKADVPNSCFGPLYKYSEMVALCERLPGEPDQFSIRTHVEANPEFTCRVPLDNLLIPHHSQMPAHLNAWDMFYAAFERGRALAEQNQRAFETARASVTDQ